MAELEELEKIKPEKVTIKIQGREREIKFTFSTWARIEKEYGGLDNLDKLFSNLDTMPYTTILNVLWLGLQDKEGLDEETFLDEYSVSDVPMITEKFNKAFSSSLPKNKDSKTKVEA